MTENKRFTLINWDNYAEGDCIYYDNGEEMGSLDVLDILNELNEENKELKNENEQLKQEMGDLGTAHAEEINKIEDEFDKEILRLIEDIKYLKIKVNFYKSFQKDASELYKENKELKAKVDDKEVAVEVECEKLMQKVAGVIDKKIAEYKGYYETQIDDQSYYEANAMKECVIALQDLKRSF